MPAVAHVGGALDADAAPVAVARDGLAGALGEGRECIRQLRDGALRIRLDRDVQALLGVAGDVGAEHPGGAEHARVRRNDRGRNAERGGEVAGVERARAAGRDEREVGRVAPAFDRDHAQGAGHVGVDHIDHGAGRPGDVPAERLGDRRDRVAGALGIERDRRAEDLAGLQAAEHDVRIGHGRQRPAAVGGRSRIRARGLRADAECAPGVEPGDRAAARADRMDVDRGRADRDPVDFEVGAFEQPAGAEADIGGGAAHVEGDRLLEASLARGREAAGRAARWPGEDGADRIRTGRGRAHRAAVGLHDAQAGRPRRERSERCFQPGEVLAHDRREVGVGRSGAHPLELAVLGQHQMGSGDGEPAGLGALHGDALVDGIDEGEDEADRERARARAGDAVEHALQFALVQRLGDFAVGGDPLGDLEAQPGGDQRLGPHRVQRVEIGARLAADRESVAEALGREQRGGRAGASQQRVGGDRRAVHDLVRPPTEFADALDHGAAGIIGRGRALGQLHAPVIDVDEVGESAAHVDAKQPHRIVLPPVR